MKNPSIAFVLVVSSLVGCGEMPDTADEESVTEQTSALTTSSFKLHNYQTGLCLGVAAGTPTPGTALITWTCDNSANQTFIQATHRYGDPASVLIKNFVADNTCMDVPDGDFADGAKVKISVCSDYNSWAPWEVWGWKPIFYGYDLNNHECYRFQHAQSKRVLGVSGANPNRGTPTILWYDYNNFYTHPDQFWCIY